MSENGFTSAQHKMRDVGVTEQAIMVFTYYYYSLKTGAAGLTPEKTIEPLTQIDALADIEVSEEQARGVLSKMILIRFNGGLSTSVGLNRVKFLLPVRDGKASLDLLVDQALAARRRYGVSLLLVLVNSFRIREDSLEMLAGHPEAQADDLSLNFLQNRESKLCAGDLTPVEWEADPELEWCPPGHDDIYTALLASELLDALLDEGYRYAVAANSDNLGAVPSARVVSWLTASGASYAPEMCRHTPVDVKGGHLAMRRSDGRIILRDTTQTPGDQMHYFTDQSRHPLFHTNNLWFDFEVLRGTLVDRGGILGLPLIGNSKMVGPTDPSSTPVIQLETAMGAAVEVLEGATATEVLRSRLLPVKIINDLLLVRSGVYEVDGDRLLQMVPDQVYTVSLDPRFYKRIQDFEARFPDGVPSVKDMQSLIVEGDRIFGADVVVIGEAHAEAEGSSGWIADGTRI